MNYELVSALAAFALVSSITPGPNNLMLMASGANFGFKRTLPHMVGISLGFAFMVILVGAGLVQIFDRFPITYQLMKIVSVIYLVYLSWKIATASKPENDNQSSKPMTFFAAALFQWVNPKAWVMALTAISVYTPSQDMKAILLVGFVFAVVNLPSVSTWAMLGQQMQRLLTSQKRLKFFNLAMAALLLSSLYPVFTS